jgi:cobalt-zinc-cadmium efflux system protein
MTGPHDRGAQSRALRYALVANGLFLGVEVAGGLIFGSLALLADAAHMLSDVGGLAIALVAHGLLTRPSSIRHTYGMQRAEVLGAQLNAVVLLATSGWILYEATNRFGDPVEVEGAGLVAVATIGLLINLGSAVSLHRSRGHSLNMTAAFLHMVMDAIGSIGALSAGIAIVVWDAGWVDPAASIGIGLLVVFSAIKLLKDTTHVLMEATPRHLDAAEVEAAIAASEGVEGVHHLHLWSLASDTPALSAHIQVSGGRSLRDAQADGARIEAMLRERFGIDHATLQLECDPCDDLVPQEELPQERPSPL